MNVVDLHPEELLDKKEAGTLTAAEAQRLDTHLAQCAACRFEIGARADFSAELDEAEAIELADRSSAPLGAPQIMAHPIVAEAMRENAPPIAPTIAANIASLSAPPIRTTRRARRGAMVLLAAAALLVAGVGWGSWREGGPRALYVALMSNDAPAPSATENVRPKPAPRGHAAATAPNAANAAGDSAEIPSLPTSSLAPDVEPVIAVQNAVNPEATPNVMSATPSISTSPIAPISPVSPRVQSAPSVGHRGSTAHPSHASSRNASSANTSSSTVAAGAVIAPMPEAAAAAAIAAPPVASPAPVVEMSAASLFDAANGARARGERDRAIALYHDLQSRFAGSNEARVSRVTLGRFLLDGGDANAALSAFDTALRDRPGELEEEAMVGRALALRRLGRDNDEAAAWNSLLSVYPTSPHAARARARLATLAR